MIPSAPRHPCPLCTAVLEVASFIWVDVTSNIGPGGSNDRVDEARKCDLGEIWASPKFRPCDCYLNFHRRSSVFHLPSHPCCDCDQQSTRHSSFKGEATACRGLGCAAIFWSRFPVSLTGVDPSHFVKDIGVLLLTLRTLEHFIPDHSRAFV